MAWREMFNRLNGWQRLWLVLAVLYGVALGYDAYREWPQPTSVGHFVPDSTSGPIRLDALEKTNAGHFVPDSTSSTIPDLPPKKSASEALGLKPKSANEALGPSKTYPLNRLIRALVNADAAGDTQAVHILAQEIQREMAASAEEKTFALDPQAKETLKHERLSLIGKHLAIWAFPVIAVYAVGVLIAWVAKGFASSAISGSRFTIKCVMVALVAAALFPPVQLAFDRAPGFYGWRFILAAPWESMEGHLRLDFPVFAVEYLVILTVGGFAYWLAERAK